MALPHRALWSEGNPMPYHGVISQDVDTMAPFVVSIIDKSGRCFGSFNASTRDEANIKMYELLKTLREGREDVGSQSDS